jgi:hypothetical protein
MESLNIGSLDSLDGERLAPGLVLRVDVYDGNSWWTVTTYINSGKGLGKKQCLVEHLPARFTDLGSSEQMIGDYYRVIRIDRGPGNNRLYLEDLPEVEIPEDSECGAVPSTV